MATATTSIAQQCSAAKRAARSLARLDSAVKNAALEAIAVALQARSHEILAANERDMQAAREAAIGDALLDRLRLDDARIAAIARAVREIAALGDPVGELIDGQRLPNGLDVRRVRVPLGVVAVVYEARPNVTIDAAALCLKSGNAIVLRGSSSAAHSNAALAAIAGEAASAAGLPDGCVTLLAGGGREQLAELATLTDTVDLIIPRGGKGLKAALQAVATVPVIYAASGNCHVYVDAGADLDQAEAIVINAKTQRPGVCNAAETLLVHRALAAEFIPRVLRSLGAAGVLVRGDERTQALAASLADDSDGDGDRAAGGPRFATVEPAAEEDWESEYLAPVLALGVVDSLEQAIEH
ncbi:MAG: glutamate-5-semialdehyde dehydrogenase, partial [Solirubrobacteraceae bacterium]|nr:glutamate-5-semialdehyde dehydrogenase [Solirubrobacteraceae bacterium]